MPDRTVFRVLEEAAELYGNAPALHQPFTKDGQRQLRTVSWADYRTAAEEIAVGLRTLGIRKGDVVALDSETRMEFYLADLGIMANGSIAAAPVGTHLFHHLHRAQETSRRRAEIVLYRLGAGSCGRAPPPQE
jgi:long-chain acyl-CoA synthetase